MKRECEVCGRFALLLKLDFINSPPVYVCQQCHYQLLLPLILDGEVTNLKGIR